MGIKAKLHKVLQCTVEYYNPCTDFYVDRTNNVAKKQHTCS